MKIRVHKKIGERNWKTKTKNAKGVIYFPLNVKINKFKGLFS